MDKEPEKKKRNSRGKSLNLPKFTSKTSSIASAFVRKKGLFKSFSRNGVEFYKLRNPSSMAYLLSNLTSLSKVEGTSLSKGPNSSRLNKTSLPKGGSLKDQLSSFKKEGLVTLVDSKQRKQIQSLLFNEKVYEVRFLYSSNSQ